MLKKKPTPPSKNGTSQKRISGRSNEAIDASLPRDIGNNLNARQTEFVKQYLVDLNATQAAASLLRPLIRFWGIPFLPGGVDFFFSIGLGPEAGRCSQGRDRRPDLLV